MNREERKQKLISSKVIKNTRFQSRKNTGKSNSNQFQTRIISSSQKTKNIDCEEEKKNEEEIVSKKIKELIDSIKESEKKYKAEEREEGHESDDFSEGGSDSESAADDIPEEELNEFQDKVFTEMQ